MKWRMGLATRKEGEVMPKTRSAMLHHLVTLTFCLLTAGCVERRFVITSDPPGAIVYDELGQPVGATPVDRQFTYYGKYKQMLVRDGFQTLIAEENVKAPWYEVYPLDFFSEVLWPFKLRDVRRLHYVMQPQQVVPAEVILDGANQMRRRGQAIGGGPGGIACEQVIGPPPGP